MKSVHNLMNSVLLVVFVIGVVVPFIVFGFVLSYLVFVMV